MAKEDVWTNPPKEKPRTVVPESEFRDKQVRAAEKEEQRLPRVSLPGAVSALKHEKWRCLHYNARSELPVWQSEPPCETAHTSFPAELADEDFTSIVCEFRQEGFVLGHDTAIKAAMRVATMRRYDPVRDYLESLEWDGMPRLELFLWACFGGNADPDDTPEEQTRERKWICIISKKWPISAVARVYEPGCQVDSVLIAESPLQGARKSSAFRALTVKSDWFASDLPDIKHKDSVHHLLGPWIIELDALNRKEATSIRGFISRRVDRARLSYRKNTANYPRRVVFCGTTPPVDDASGHSRSEKPSTSRLSGNGATSCGPRRFAGTRRARRGGSRTRSSRTSHAKSSRSASKAAYTPRRFAITSSVTRTSQCRLTTSWTRSASPPKAAARCTRTKSLGRSSTAAGLGSA